jgi:hypothetical protein
MPPQLPPQTFEEITAEELAILRGPDKKSPGDQLPLSALCISGGGIRSATFGLGVIQGLAQTGVLGEFDYLSTVSGGGYIGGWLTTWKERAGGIENVIQKLRPRAPQRKPDELDPIGHLREYNNYLSPKLGFFSADTWTLIATVTRNMFLNWLVLVPMLMAPLMLPRLILALGLLKDTHSLKMPSTLGYSIAALGSLLLATAIFNTMRYLPGVGAKPHTERDFLVRCLAPIVLAALTCVVYDSWFDPDMNDLGPPPSYLVTLIWITGSSAAGWLTYLGFCVSGFRARLRALFGPLSIAVVLTGVSTATVEWLLIAKSDHIQYWSTYITIGAPALLLAFLLAGSVFVGLTSRALGDDDREWLSRGTAWTLLFIVGWTGICGLVLIAPTWIFRFGNWARSSIAAAGGIAGWICSLTGFRSRSVPSENTDDSRRGIKATLMDVAAKLAAPVFVGIFLAELSVLTNWMMAATNLIQENWTHHEDVLDFTRAEVVIGVALFYMASTWIAARFININKFSLHAMYRSRLIRAYLGASNKHTVTDQFIGFAQSDNIQMSALTPSIKPFHIVNITLNLVGGDRLAWQQRKAESFTISPLHSGCARLGYRPSAQYGGPQGISLGTAITISGAAASPSMGYHSSGVIGFIMTLFNARLGAWLGNPGPAGDATWQQDGPSSAVGSLVREALGMTNDSSSWVYLSDGGHFENLGLYEMVMRRAKRIVVLDGGCDVSFTYEDLGNALRKIRIDTGIPVEFSDDLLKPLREGQKRCALATIRYSLVDASESDGILLYIKPIMLGNEPPDVTTYKAAHKDFPHQGTGNQWYDESQTESYRMLGLHSVQEMTAGWSGEGGLSGMFDYVADHYLGRGRAMKTVAGL